MLLKSLLAQARQTAVNAAAAQEDREMAIDVLNCTSFTAVHDTLSSLIDIRQPEPIQLAAISATEPASTVVPGGPWQFGYGAVDENAADENDADGNDQGTFCLLILDRYLFHQLFFLYKPITMTGTIFISLLKMVMVPLIFTSIIIGVSSIESGKRISRIGLKTLSYYVVTSLCAIIIGLSLANIFKPGHREIAICSNTSSL